MPADLFGGWTKGRDGKYIDWTKPPHYVRGVLNLVLPGEEDVSEAVLRQRREEYMRLTKRRMARKTKNAPSEETERGVGEKQDQLF